MTFLFSVRVRWDKEFLQVYVHLHITYFIELILYSQFTFWDNIKLDKSQQPKQIKKMIATTATRALLRKTNIVGRRCLSVQGQEAVGRLKDALEQYRVEK